MSEMRAYGLEDGRADALAGKPMSAPNGDSAEYDDAYREAYDAAKREEAEDDDDAEPVVTVSQENGHDGPWTARCTCGWAKDRAYASDAQFRARKHGEETGHDASNA